LESAFVRCEQATEQRWIEALEIFNGITQVERRLQVQKRRHVAHGPGKIEQHRGLAGNLGQLHGEVHGDGGAANATFGTQHDK